MARRIYIIVGAVALSIIIYLLFNLQTFTSTSVIWMVTILYAVVIASIHGVLAHSLSAKQKGNMIFYPLFMGVLFSVFAFIYMYVLLPILTQG